MTTNRITSMTAATLLRSTQEQFYESFCL